MNEKRNNPFSEDSIPFITVQDLKGDLTLQPGDIIFSSDEQKELDEMARIIKGIRQNENLTAEEFGRRIGMTQNYLGRLEAGLIKNPGLFTVAKIAKAIAMSNAIKDGVIDLNNYKGTFAILVRGYISAEGIKVEHKTVPNDIVDYVRASLDDINKNTVQFIANSISYNYLNEAVRNLLSETAKFKFSNGFALDMVKLVNEAITSQPEFSNRLNDLYSHALINDRASDVLILEFISGITDWIASGKAQKPRKKRTRTTNSGHGGDDNG